MSLFRKMPALVALGAAVLASGPALADPPWARGWHGHGGPRHWRPPPAVVYPPPPPRAYYYAPPPVYYAPPPPPPVVYAPPPAYYAPPSLGFSFNVPLR